MLLAVCGICGREEQLWCLMAMFKEFTLSHSHRMGQYTLTLRPISSLIPKPRYQVATGSGDDTIRLWDIRSLKALYTIPAHLSNVSDIRFFHADDLFYKPLTSTTIDENTEMNGVDEELRPRDTPDSEKPKDQDSDSAKGYTEEEWRYRSGLFFTSAGYDGLVKIWSADDWQLLRTLTTDAGKVMSVDISSDGAMIASGTYNRNFQLYTPEDLSV